MLATRSNIGTSDPRRRHACLAVLAPGGAVAARLLAQGMSGLAFGADANRWILTRVQTRRRAHRKSTSLRVFCSPAFMVGVPGTGRLTTPRTVLLTVNLCRAFPFLGSVANLRSTT